jgi:hypothetical protein
VSKLVVLVSDLQKGLFSVCICYVLRKTSRFLCTGAPVFGITQEGFGGHAARHLFISSSKEQENQSAMCLSKKICRALQKSHKLPGPVDSGVLCQWPK